MNDDLRLKQAGAVDYDALAATVVNVLVERLKDEKTVEAIVAVWSRQVDNTLGRAVRRAIGTVILAFLIVVGVKLNAIVDWLKG